MKKTVFLFLGVLLLLSCSRKKLDYSEKVVDSIPIYLVLANEDTVPHQKRLEYNKKAFDVFIRQKNDSMNRKNLFKIANRYYNMGSLEEYKKTTDIVLRKAIEQNDTASITKAYSYLGDYYLERGKLDTAYSLLLKAERFYHKLKRKEDLVTIYLNKSLILSYGSDFLGSEIQAIKALKIAKENGNIRGLYDAYNQLGFVSVESKNHEKALEYHTKALQLADKNNLDFPFSKVSSLNNIGNVYQRQNKNKLAIDTFKEGIRLIELKNKKHYLHAVLLDNFAYSKFKLKDFTELPGLFYQSLAIRDSLNLGLGVIHVKNHLSEYYFEQKDSVKATKFAHEAYERAKLIKNPRSILACLKQLTTVELHKASYYKQEYIKLSDSLYFEERKIRDKFALLRYETDEIIVEKDKAVLQKWTMFWIAVSVLLSGLVFYVLRLRQSRQRELNLLFSRWNADEKIYHMISDLHQKFEEGRKKEKRRIARELHDGVMSRLSDIRSNLLILENKTDSETVRHCINQVAEMQDVEKEVRDIAHGLGRDLFSTKRDYPELLASVTGDSANKTSLKIDLEIDKAIDWNVLDSRKKLGVYQILQEYFNCMDKQEIGTDATVHFYKNNSLLIMEVDGILLDIKNREKEQILKGISLRAKEMGADLRISHILGGKTLLKMTILMKTGQNF